MNAHAARTRRTPWTAVFAIITALVYGASPLDLIPDLIPLVGVMDDALLILLAVTVGLVAYARHRRNGGAVVAPAPRRVPAAPPVIPATYPGDRV